MEMNEGTKPADVQPGMLLKVLRKSPMLGGQTAVIDPGYYKEWEDFFVILINKTDFPWFAHEIEKRNLTLSRRSEDAEGNEIYTIEERSPIVVPGGSQ